MRSVLSAEAETAIGLVNTARAALQLELRCQRVGSALRLPRLAARGLPSRREYALNSSVLRVVSVAEEFHRSSLARVVEARLSSDEMAISVWERTARDLDLAWHRQTDAWKEWFGIEVEKADEYKRFHPFVDARNAIVHGLGALTRTQLGRDGGKRVRDELGKGGIVVVGTRLVIDEAAVATCARSASAFVSWLDRKASGLP